MNRFTKSNRHCVGIFGAVVASIGVLNSCGKSVDVQAKNPADAAATPTAAVSVGVVKVGRSNLQRSLTVSSELVPFQEIDVFAKESGYVKELMVDYGTHVKQGQVMAILEIPELQLQLKEDDANIRDAADMITHAQKELDRVKAQQKVYQLQYDRLNGVAKAKPGLVAQQEVDDAEGRALASSAQVEESASNLQAAESKLADMQAKRERDQALYDYSRITAPFSGVVTQRYANEGTLMQAGTNSSTQVLPLVRLSEDDKFRLVIPVPESYVRYIRTGDPVTVNVPSLNQSFPGTVARFSADVREDTRTMHTEVDVPNPRHILYPGLYAEATVTFERRANVLAVPVQAVNQGDHPSVDVVTAANKIEIRPVVLGLQTPSDAEVLSGLSGGESVVIGDRSALKTGEAVTPKVVELADTQGQE